MTLILDADPEPKETEPFQLRFKDGKERIMVLRELDTPSYVKFQSFVTADATVNTSDGSIKGPIGVAAVNAMLVQLCLKEVDGRERRPVTKSFVESIHPQMVERLAKMAVGVNPILGGEKDQAKN